jgi:putative heme-binding domain-containing protein
VDHGQEEVIEFTAPTAEGAYPYICSFPGHHLIMRGVLIVTDNLKEFLAKNPQPVLKITEWKTGDFTNDLNRVAQNRNLDRGKLLFTAIACAQCHRLSKADVKPDPLHAGHHHGPSIAVGPNVEDVVKKHRGDAKAMLLEILEPSRSIEEKYRKVTFELDSGSIVAGNVVSEDKEAVTIVTAPPEAKEQKIAKSAIESRQPSAVSIMPVGLLNTLDKEQILDLLAYLLAAGSPAASGAPKHGH